MVQTGHNLENNIKETGREFEDNLAGLRDGQGNFWVELLYTGIDLGEGALKTGVDFAKDSFHTGIGVFENTKDTVVDLATDSWEFLKVGYDYAREGAVELVDNAVEFYNDKKETAQEFWKVAGETINRKLEDIFAR